MMKKNSTVHFVQFGIFIVTMSYACKPGRKKKEKSKKRKKEVKDQAYTQASEMATQFAF